jgi:hypothetical protein
MSFRLGIIVFITVYCYPLEQFQLMLPQLNIIDFNCSLLSPITIPNNVISIGDYWFLTVQRYSL